MSTMFLVVFLAAVCASESIPLFDCPAECPRDICDFRSRVSARYPGVTATLRSPLFSLDCTRLYDYNEKGAAELFSFRDGRLTATSIPALTAGVGWVLKRCVAVPLPSLASDEAPIVIPDGEWLAEPGDSAGPFHSTDSNLCLQSLQGSGKNGFEHEHEAAVPLRVFANHCVFSYSMPFATAQDWFNLLDAIALRGWNAPLMFVGAEALQYRVFAEMGLTRKELDAFFAGPAFSAWQRMGNLRAYGGPLPARWLLSQLSLGKAVLRRARALGMTPILPGFSGFVPDALRRILPDANIVPSSQWWETTNETICCNRMLAPTEPAFAQVGRRYYETLVAEYGTDHLYSADTFNEMNPTNTSLSFLRESSAAVIAPMVAVDPDAVWVMQGWLFYAGGRFWTDERTRAYLGGVDDERFIVLDLMSEVRPLWHRYPSYYGKRFVYSLLHNFGGVRGVYGDLEAINEGFHVALRETPSALTGTLSGLGLSMEAIDQNPIVYELQMEALWLTEPVKLDKWVDSYVAARYGRLGRMASASVRRAWHLLLASAYASPVLAKPLLGVEPRVNLQSRHVGWFWLHQPSHTQVIDTTAIQDAAQHLLTAALAVEASGTPLSDRQRYDLIDVATQAVNNAWWDVERLYEWRLFQWLSHGSTAQAARDEVADELLAIGRFALRVGRRLDDLLATHREFLLGRWMAKAQAAPGWTAAEAGPDLDDVLRNGSTWITPLEGESLDAAAPAEGTVRSFAHSALNLVTLWGPDGEISDYSSRMWAGLVADYHVPRWKRLFRAVDKAVRSDTLSSSWHSALLRQSLRENQAFGNDPASLAVDRWPSTVDPAASTTAAAKRLLDLVLSPKHAWTLRKGWVCAPPLHVATLSLAESPADSDHLSTALQTWSTHSGLLSTLCGILPSCTGWQSTGVLLTMGEDGESKGKEGASRGWADDLATCVSRNHTSPGDDTYWRVRGIVQ
uniref:Alpha-N-acetylglucosaminidase n=1 Tax=Sexangularia sp. CB-2014 TaxID=1486929 RepID=A0A7S1VNE5_9EUKA|mmetsp:Transcript_697/g.2162  ORF Transcript_697/g.2162 Transcript_697/m.2162 type:complete len:961 (+) Transcript_697:33-2915(+)